MTFRKLPSIEKSPFFYIISTCLILWASLFVICILISRNILASNTYEIYAWPSAFAIHFFTMFLLFKIIKNFQHNDRKTMIWFLIINIWLFMVDFFFYLATEVSNNYVLQLSFIQFLLYYAPCIIYCIMMIIFLSKILLRDVLPKQKFIKIVFSLLAFNMLTMLLFLLSIHYAFSVISWETISQIVLLAAELILFDFAVLGLIYANNSSIILLLSGPIFLVNADFFITYSYISQTIHLMLYGQVLWILGLLFIMFSALNIKKNKHYSLNTWFTSSNAIKSKLAFWVFSTSICGFLLFFIVAYLFSFVTKAIFVGLPIFVMIYSVIAIILSLFMGKSFEVPFNKLTTNIQLFMTEHNKDKLDKQFSINEFVFLNQFVINAIEAIEEKDKTKKELGEITAQVAHDIRSPLSALDMVITSLADKVPEQERIMMRTAFRRINNIANDLVAKYKGKENNPDIILFVYVVLKDIISEKDLEHGNKVLSFELLLDDPQTAFVITEGNYKEMRRMLSNLINNAVNAMPEGGKIQVICERKEGTVLVKIRDQGCGLEKGRIAQLLSDDQAQSAGIGLGLKHGKDYVKKHGGSFSMQSKVGEGTEVSLSLPILPKPKWLAEKLEIDLNKSAMIIDDDNSIHDIWTKKFEGFALNREDFYKTEDARQALREKNSQPGLILCDYEFIGQEEVGLQFLESIQDIQAEKYLVTTHVDNGTILNQCEDLGLQLIPKHLLPYITITVSGELASQEKRNTDFPDAVMIDDEPYNHEFWQFAAKLKDKKLLCFLSLEEFNKKAAKIPFDMPIYVDLNLKMASGLDVTKELHERGFTKLYIATGLIDFDPKDYPYLSGVQDKDPPF